MKMIDLEKLPNDIGPSEYRFLLESSDKLEVNVNKEEKNYHYLLNLEKDKYVKIIDENVTDTVILKFGLRQKAIDLLNRKDILFESIQNNCKCSKPKVKEINNEIKNWISEYREVFKNTGKTGIASDDKTCTQRMQWFIKNYPEYNDKELIINSAKKYVNSQTDYRFLQRADYFIWKAETDKTRISRLAAFCEELKDKNGTNEGFTQML